MEILQVILSWVDSHWWRLIGAWILLIVVKAVVETVGVLIAARRLMEDK